MSILPLNFFTEGESGIIEDLRVDDNLFKRLASMGFNKGTKLKIVKNDLGPLIIALGENRVALERRIAHRIMIEPSEFNYD